eukprot:TRINITY_DN30750_c0_g1_i1.p1 TRINITY_DN30750_c0_g1~~TRINITY_DN30750_c0_g1_i1.p1  ORF type:complete len:363 (+),score=93.60 TRINITY_DN30750_c0_g1_i1:1213-2301(+)
MGHAAYLWALRLTAERLAGAQSVAPAGVAERELAFLPRHWQAYGVLAQPDQAHATVHFVAPGEAQGGLLGALRRVRPTNFEAAPHVWADAARHAQAAGGLAACGLDRCRWGLMGGTVGDPSVPAFFERSGLPLFDVYGSNETGAVATLGRPGVAAGGVPAVPGCVALLQPGGEICVRHRGLMRGYLREMGQPPDTSAVIDSRGWAHTGDAGEMRDGLVHLRGRIDDIISPAGTVTVAPGPIEAALLSAAPGYAHCVVVGDGRPHLAALFAPRQGDGAGGGAAGCPLAPLPPAADAAVRRAAAAHAETCAHPSHRVLSWGALREPFRAGRELQGPMHKVNRRAVRERHRAALQALYEPTSASR